jgi:hypothetical protein
MTFADVDLDRGAVRLDKNKTDDPRAWALDPGVALALKLWKEHFRGGVEDGAFILVEPDIRKHPAARRICVDRLAVRFRAHLKKAKVTRPALFEKSPTRRPVRIHDLRATFVTLALANGKTEAWIADRTGHRSSVMINRYRRAARKVEELGLGTLTPLHLAIPELAKLAKLLPIPAKAPQSQPQSQRASSRVSERHRDMAKTSGKVATRYPRRTHLREFRFRRRKS